MVTSYADGYDGDFVIMMMKMMTVIHRTAVVTRMMVRMTMMHAAIVVRSGQGYACSTTRLH